MAGAASGAVAVVVAPSALAAPRPARPLLRGGRFAEGVASGDPTPNAVTLWTRVADVEGAGSVRLEVARDPGFRRVVARERIATSGSSGHSVKARVDGLRPGERYWYRFETAGEHSPVGRTQTALPADSREPVRFAFFSCQEFTFGWYNAHALLAREDVDFVVNLGDYIYGDVALPKPLGVRTDPTGSVTTVEGYRRKYAQYRSDANLRRVNGAFPMISCWDDHEVTNDYAGGDPAGGPAAGNYTQARRAAGYRAFFESMPTFAVGRSRSRLYHRAAFGRTVDLFVLDERQYRAGQPCGNESGPGCADLGAERPFLGAQQQAFLRSGLDRSRAAWKIIANEVMIMPTKATPTDFTSFDAWQGYPREREALLSFVRRERIRDVVFVTGDYHAFIAGDVRTADGTTVATEFVGGGMTSLSDSENQILRGNREYGTYERPRTPAPVLRELRAANPWFDELDFDHHGYAVVEATRDDLTVAYRKLLTTRRRGDLRRVAGPRWRLRRGQRGIVD